MLGRRALEQFDLVLVLLIFVIAGWGILTIYSATGTEPSGRSQGVYLKQLTWLAYGAVAMLVAILIDYHIIGRYAYVLYGLAILGLIVVLVMGSKVSGSQRWLALGGIRLQPSEFAKIALILALANFFATSQKLTPRRFVDLIVPGLMTVLPFVLILKQPDLGTSMMILVIFAALALSVGVERRTLLSALVLGLVALPVLWFIMKDYQRARVLTLFSPESDPLGAGYHSMQSMIAIGSGGFTGKGIFAGTQSRLNFLPERHTDFIFGVLSEELGFIGGVCLLILFLILILRGMDIALTAQDRLGALIAVGVVALFSVSTAANIGMTIGLLPVVGLPLPLMSYGGSSLVTTMFSFGLLINVRLRRYRLP